MKLARTSSVDKTPKKLIAGKIQHKRTGLGKHYYLGIYKASVCSSKLRMFAEKMCSKMGNKSNRESVKWLQLGLLNDF